MERKKRTVIAQKKRINFNNPNLGKVTPIAEDLGDHYASLTEENFCETNEIFITGNYQNAIDEKFRDGEFFKVHVHENAQFSENNLESDGSPRCKYVASGSDIERLTPKDIVQIVTTDEIPDANSKFISSDILPSTTYIYLAAVNIHPICIGPFKWARCEGGYNISFIDAPFPGSRNLPSYHIFKFDALQFMHCIFHAKDFAFVFNMNEIHNKAEFYDYSSDENIVKYFIEQTNLCSLKNEKTQLSSLGDALKRNPKSHAKSPIFKKNFERLSEIVVDVELARDEISEGVQKFFKSESGLEIINAFVLKHEDKYLDNIKSKRKEEIENSIQLKLDDLQKLELQKQNLSNELKEIHNKIEKNKEQANDHEDIRRAEFSKNLDQDLSSKQKELDKINIEIKNLSEKYQQLNKLDDIEQQIEKKHNTLDSLHEQKLRLEKIESDLIEKINHSKDKLQEKLMDLKPYVDAINGAFMSRDLHIPNIYISTKNIEVTEQTKNDRQLAVIDTILANIQQKDPNRVIQKIDLANLLICTQQSFLTFLAGLPGVGKTSLCRLFVDGQEVKNRFKEVAVSRGWTSQKDLVGFFNPLTNRFQPSQTGLYQFLYALNDETKKGNKDNPMAYILLDEANLSPIEHYWATFMGMTDNKKNMTLQLGQDIIKVPDYLRFIATINYDSTTEPLSPRIIDRAPIIVLGGDIVDFKEIIEESLYELPINTKSLDELFGSTSTKVEFDDSELQIFRNIQDELNKSDRDLGRPIHLSARKENSIKQYCFQARAIMRHLNLNQDNSDVIALDYAVLQFVLPQVKGNGNKFKKRLESLLNIFQDNKLKKSADYLEHMIRYGEDELHTYDFFCW